MGINELISNTDEAESSYNSAKDELKGSLDKLLQAAGLGSIALDHLEQYYRSDEYLYITTTWSCRGCTNSSDYKIPLSIIDAKDPMAAAVAYKDAEDKRKAERKQASTLAQIKYLQSTLGE